MATLPSASRSRRSRMTRLCTLSPSRPASGESLTEMVIAKVGGSIGVRGDRRRRPRCRRACRRRLRSARPAMATMSPASARSTGTRARPRNASSLVTRARSITLPSRFSALIRRLTVMAPDSMRPVSTRPEIGIGFQRRHQHRERKLVARLRHRLGLRHVGDDALEQRRQILVLVVRDRATAQPWRPEA